MRDGITMKESRQQKIIDIISEKKIQTQEQLLLELQAAGFAATQATISRDIRSLKLVKKNSEMGSYYYSAPPAVSVEARISLQPSLLSSVHHVAESMNIIVIKTTPGMASAVAVGIDQQDTKEILGCIAGDDTIFVVTDTVESAAVISQKIKEQLSI